MFWLGSRICQLLPPSSDRYSAFFGGSASTNAYTTFGFDWATLTATRPQGLLGNPCAPEISLHDAPPSVDLNNPLPLAALGPSPPDRNVHPLRRKSHSPA